MSETVYGIVSPIELLTDFYPRFVHLQTLLRLGTLNK
jgi:hypothetical protein